jgi:hypothetical protein
MMFSQSDIAAGSGQHIAVGVEHRQAQDIIALRIGQCDLVAGDSRIQFHVDRRCGLVKDLEPDIVYTGDIVQSRTNIFTGVPACLIKWGLPLYLVALRVSMALQLPDDHMIRIIPNIDLLSHKS